MSPRALGYATVAVLRALDEGARYGLDVMDRTGLPSGTVYPTLGRLEKRGFVTGRWEDEGAARAEGRPRRRYYRLTAAGSESLREAIRRFGALAGDGVGDAAPEEA